VKNGCPSVYRIEEHGRLRRSGYYGVFAVVHFAMYCTTCHGTDASNVELFHRPDGRTLSLMSLAGESK
jgi:hypothetical protein